MRAFATIALLALTQLVGCASIVNGQNQSLSVETKDDAGPAHGALCTLVNDKGKWFVTTPGSVVVQRSKVDLAVRCERAASEPGIATARSGVKGMAFGNILFGGIIGAGVDIATGAAFDYPELLTVIMGKTVEIYTPQVGPANGAPCVPIATPPHCAPPPAAPPPKP